MDANDIDKVVLANIIEIILKEGGRDREDIVDKTLKYCFDRGFTKNAHGNLIIKANTTRHLNDILIDVTEKIRSKRWHKYTLKEGLNFIKIIIK